MDVVHRDYTVGQARFPVMLSRQTIPALARETVRPKLCPCMIIVGRLRSNAIMGTHAFSPCHLFLLRCFEVLSSSGMISFQRDGTLCFDFLGPPSNRVQCCDGTSQFPQRTMA